MPSVTIIGVGRVGGALEISFRDSEYEVTSLIRRGDPIEGVLSDIVIIATPDNEIVKVSAELARNIVNKPIVLHTSGALSSSELSVLSDAGCSVGSLHPLVSLSSAELGAKRFLGAFFCLEGDGSAVDAAKAIVHSLGGLPFEIQTANKALYHAAAVTACGHVTALIDMAFSMMERSGVNSELSSEILAPLIRSTINNIDDLGTEAAITGTFARADVDGLIRQLAAFEGVLSDEELEIYLDLARRSLEIARRRGVDADKIENVEKLISMAKSKLQ